MKNKQFGFLILILAILISPLSTQAQSQGKNLVQNKEPQKAENKIEAKNKVASSAMATSSKNKERTRAEENKTRTVQASNNIAKNINRHINKIRNIINRLTKDDSIIAKLDDKGINTENIKTKLAEAEALVVKAEADIQTAKEMVTSVSTSTNPSIKTKVTGVRKLFSEAHLNLKLALTKVKEAYKLIKEIPGLREIEKNKIATSTPEEN